MAVLDATFLIALERRDPAAQRLLADVESFGGPLRIPTAVFAEILTGLPPAHRQVARSILRRGAILEPFTDILAEIVGELQWALRATGQEMPWHDAQVAATALHYREPLISSDSVFGRVPGLEWHPH